MREKVLVLSAKFEELVGEIRTVPNWTAARYLNQIWLRGPIENGDQQVLLLSLPVMASYELDEAQRLFRQNEATPSGMLQEMDWLALKEFLPVKFPVSALPASLAQQIQVKLLRTVRQKPAFLLKTNLASWKAYVEGAPLIRLQQLRFAMSSDEEVFIIGDPLPPIPGRGYWRHSRLLIPLGFDFNPPLLADLLSQRFTDEDDSYIIFNENGSRTHLSYDVFTAATRALIRQI
ncbi:hypothetical protein [Pedobacter helvus]|uniref:MoxR-vWA-beta-propeller ternary system domain-containing protein n=1 Tax=Pedobacter helvus TaxID=2563444 RepID=A0ABW9JJD4_9SPHI|nr:hypothetical protein [Pedobacter ureilyticus]